MCLIGSCSCSYLRMDVNRILYMTSFLLTCSSDDPLSRYVFQCLVRSSLDHRAESHRVCSAAPVMTMYGQQSRVHTRACLSLSWPREVFMRWRTTSLGPVALHLPLSWAQLVRLRDAHASDTQAPESLAPCLQFLLFFSFCSHYRACQYKMFSLAGKHFISLTQVARVSRFRVPTTFC